LEGWFGAMKKKGEKKGLNPLVMRCELFLKPLQKNCEGFVCPLCYGLGICDMKIKKAGGDVVIITTQSTS
jgi:hypothetical protein